MFKQFTASAPGKIILTGEHAVVHGTRAIATVVDKRTFATFSAGNERKLTFFIHYAQSSLRYTWDLSQLDTIISTILQHVNPKLNISTKDELFDYCAGTDHSLDHIVDVIDAKFVLFPEPLVERLDGEGVDQIVPIQQLSSALELCPPKLFLTYYILYFQCRLPSIQIETRSDLPMGAGLGSSASLCAALCGGFRHLLHILDDPSPSTCDVVPSFTDEDLHIINRWAYQGERIIHGNASGVDNTCCVYGGVIIYRREPGASQPDLSFLPSGSLPSSMSLIITNTKVPKDTKALVAKVGKLKQERPAVMTPLLESFDNLAKQYLDAIELYLEETQQAPHPLPPVTLEPEFSLARPTMIETKEQQLLAQQQAENVDGITTTSGADIVAYDNPTQIIFPEEPPAPGQSISVDVVCDKTSGHTHHTTVTQRTCTAIEHRGIHDVDQEGNQDTTVEYETTETTYQFETDIDFPTEVPLFDQPALRLYGAFSELFPINQHLLEAIGVGHPKITQVCEVSNRFNLVTKLTGAGGGGCVITIGSPQLLQPPSSPTQGGELQQQQHGKHSPAVAQSPGAASQDGAQMELPSHDDESVSSGATAAALVNQTLGLSLDTSAPHSSESVKSPIDLFEDAVNSLDCECYRTVMGQRGVMVEYLS